MQAPLQVMGDRKCSIFPIERVAHNWAGFSSDFDVSILPLKIIDDVHVEDVPGLMQQDEFRYCREMLGTEMVKHIENFKYATVHRFTSPIQDPKGRRTGIRPGIARSVSISCASTHRVFASNPPHRATRPVHGRDVEADGTFRHFHFDHPVQYLSPLPIQALMRVRTQDLLSLVKYAPRFIAAMEGNFWKYRMAVDMFQSGFFQETHWKLRFFMWTAALEALFTSHTNPEHRGSFVTKERIKKLLRSSCLVYPSHELSEYDVDPKLTVGKVLDQIYCLRNHIAHGDKVPNYYFKTPVRQAINGPVMKKDVLTEAISSIVRQCILAILDKNLLRNFANDATAEAYFSKLGLTNALLKNKKRKRFKCPS
jgi:hypothetical protein